MTKITGTKTPAQKAKALKTAKGPKAGSARANQSAKLSAADQKQIKDEGLARRAKASKVQPKPGAIKEVKTTVNGSHVVVSTGADKVTYPRTAETAELKKLAVVGASLKAVQDYLKTHKPEAKLARGLDGRSAPQSAMAAADSRKVGNDAATAKGASAQAGAKSKGSAGAVSTKGDFAYAVGKANDTREGTWTHYMVGIIQSKTDTGHAKAAHAKTGQYANKKLDFTWAKAKGFIK